jgi:F-type H+-transporting ATPase subunit b
MILARSVLVLVLAATSGENAAPLNPLEWKTDLALWTGVVFVVLLLILWKYAWKPIAEGLDNRERNIANQIAGAEAAHQKAQGLLAEYERKLATAGDQVRGILEQGRRDAEQVGHALIDKAKEESHAEQQRAMQQIEAATAAAVKELADQSARLAVDLAGKIVHAKLSAEDHAQLIEQAVAGFVQNKGDASHG